MAKQFSVAHAQAVGKRLRLTREAMGLSIVAFCRLAGIEANAWSNYEAGTRRISLESAIKVCLASGVTLDWIYLGSRAGLPVRIASVLGSSPPVDGRVRRKTG